KMFTVGEEPYGERVSSYHKIKRTELIIDVLEPEEIEFWLSKRIRHFRVHLDNMSLFDLVLFAGNPVIMSLEKFATVTRLNCGKIPDRPKKKKRNPLNEKLYWNELLGTLNLCTVDIVIDMLKQKKTRIKFACLAITSYIFFLLDIHLDSSPSTAAYQTLATSLIAKEKITLSQASVAIKGYVDAIQHVLLIAIPQLKKKSFGMGLSFLLSQKVREGHLMKTLFQRKTIWRVAVKSILDDPYEEWSAGADFDWFDEIEDDAVDNMVRLIFEGFAFRKEMFIGSLTANDLAPMRLEKKHKEKEPKEKNNKYNTADMSDGEGSDPQSHIGIANFVTSQFSDKFRSTTRDIRDEISSLESRLDHAMNAKIEKLVESTNHAQHIALLQATVFGSLQEIERKLTNALVDNVKIMQSAVIKGKGLFTHNDIDGILRDLNEMSQVSPQVNLDGAEVHQELQGPNVAANPLSMSPPELGEQSAQLVFQHSNPIPPA
ncbi:hypothetical protein HID58_070289, partial [Brassica napus]